MTQATKDSQDTGSPAPAGELDASVSAIIDQLIPSEVDSEDLPDLEPGPEEQVASTATPAAVSAPEFQPAAIPEAPPEEEDLLQAVNNLLSEPPPAAEAQRVQTSEAPTELELPADLLAPVAADLPVAADPVDPAGASQIDSLDKEIAGIADELISTEIAAEPEQGANDGPTLAAAVAAATEAPAQPVSPASVSPPPADAPAEPPPPPAFSGDVPTFAPAEAPAAPLLERLLRPLLLLCAAVSAPLHAKPKHVRDKIGWHALWLAFLGVCVWTYVLFFRSPEPAVPSLLPTRAASVEGAGSSKDHGATPAKKQAAKPADKKKSGGH